MNPEPAIYLTICHQMGVAPGHFFSLETGRVVMIGDSRRCDGMAHEQWVFQAFI